MTTRNLVTRVNEHKKGNSNITSHLDSCLCKERFSISNFDIIDYGQTPFEVKIKESLYIKKFRPNINIMSLNRNEYTLKLFN